MAGDEYYDYEDWPEGTLKDSKWLEKHPSWLSEDEWTQEFFDELTRSYHYLVNFAKDQGVPLFTRCSIKQFMTFAYKHSDNYCKRYIPKY